ncbi:hypothetical protein, partial [Aquincola tertiaricarbonis]|uniref:hypothetical protein n=1 Tax=Aquincola tertiaricarbonis TaxID=391953 RepID=UPI0012EDF6B3
MQLVPKLVPREPPGRTGRKVSAYRDEILRLHAEGYTFRAIRDALLDEGIDVHVTTVQREAARGAASRRRPASATMAPAARAVRPAESAMAWSPGQRTGKEIAA